MLTHLAFTIQAKRVLVSSYWGGIDTQRQKPLAEMWLAVRFLSLILGVGEKNKGWRFLSGFQKIKGESMLWLNKCPAPYGQRSCVFRQGLPAEWINPWGLWGEVFAGIWWGQRQRKKCWEVTGKAGPTPSHPSFLWWNVLLVLIATRMVTETPLWHSDGHTDFSVSISRFAPGHELSASPLSFSLFWFLGVKKNDVLAVGEGRRVHFLSAHHAALNIALPK